MNFWEGIVVTTVIVAIVVVICFIAHSVRQDGFNKQQELTKKEVACVQNGGSWNDKGYGRQSCVKP